MAVFRIPGPLRSVTGGQSSVEVSGATLREAIDNLDSLHPGIKARLLDETGTPRQFVNLYLNDEDIRMGEGVESRLGERDEIAIVPAVAGGR